MIASMGAGFEIIFQVKLRMGVPTYADIASKLFVLAGTAAIFAASMAYTLDSLTLFYAVIGVVRSRTSSALSGAGGARTRLCQCACG